MNRDFREFFALLNARKVPFLVIGGVAFNFHAPPRATKDIDVWVEPSAESLAALIAAIEDFGFPTAGLTPERLRTEQRVLMLGRVPNRIDVLSQPSGIDWHGAWERRMSSDYDGVPIQVLGIEDLILTKEAAGRPRDLADVATLRQIASRGSAP